MKVSRTAARAMLPATIAIPPQPIIAVPTETKVYESSPEVRISPSSPKRISRTTSRSGMNTSRSSSTASTRPGT